MNYGSASLEGLRSSDTICLTNEKIGENLCLNDFEFFLISKQTGLTANLDGVLGLSRSSVPDGKMPKNWRGIGPVYIHNLAKAGMIRENLFAFYLESFSNEHNQDGAVSFVDIGESVKLHMKPDIDVVWFDLIPHFYWQVGMM